MGHAYVVCWEGGGGGDGGGGGFHLVASLLPACQQITFLRLGLEKITRQRI